MSSNQNKFPFVLKDLSESEPEKVRNVLYIKKNKSVACDACLKYLK